MALKQRKDIKKSSYYVWFLGAKESKGLRGADFILPVIQHLEQRERDVEPFKVTLQVSPKGLKIVQNVAIGAKKTGGGGKGETIKHFIPHNTITCVWQKDDVIACVLLLFNPVTKCPLHVHAYRCDSVETASLLRAQLQALIDRPENQKKFAEIEARLRREQGARPPTKKVESSVGSDTGTSTRESESSEERFVVEATRATTLYDSVAAELRAKLAKNNVPILLPPRDYDTVHRAKGNLTGIELRRCLNPNIIGQNGGGGAGTKTITKRLASSGGSSGIGSDHPPSPESPDANDSRFNTLDNRSTSDDDDWNEDTAESALYLTHAPPPVTFRRSKGESKSPERFAQSGKAKSREAMYLEKPIAKYGERSRGQRGLHEGEEEHRAGEGRREAKGYKYFEDDGFDEKIRYKTRPVEIPRYAPQPRTTHHPRQRSPTPSPPTSPRDRFHDAKEKFLSMEKDHEPPILRRHESLRPQPVPRMRAPAEPAKRRSMFGDAEAERRRHGGEIARELRRRSHLAEGEGARREWGEGARREWGEEREAERAGDVERFKSQGRGYRHSYAEAKGGREERRGGAGRRGFEMVQRTNSVSNNGRIGIASLHLY